LLDLALAPLSRFNSIAGTNNTGKTALLEAMFLHSFPRECLLPLTVSERRKPVSEQRTVEINPAARQALL
jgi:AAA15 family ATPase/GTPase